MRRLNISRVRNGGEWTFHEIISEPPPIYNMRAHIRSVIAGLHVYTHTHAVRLGERVARADTFSASLLNLDPARHACVRVCTHRAVDAAYTCVKRCAVRNGSRATRSDAKAKCAQAAAFDFRTLVRVQSVKRSVFPQLFCYKFFSVFFLLPPHVYTRVFVCVW